MSTFQLCFPLPPLIHGLFNALASRFPFLEKPLIGFSGSNIYDYAHSFFQGETNGSARYSRIIPKSRCLFKFHFIPVPLIRSYPRSILLPLNLARESGNALCPNFHVSNSTLQFVINSGGGTFLFVLSVLRFRNIYTVIRVNSWTGYKKIFYKKIKLYRRVSIFAR